MTINCTDMVINPTSNFFGAAYLTILRNQQRGTDRYFLGWNLEN
jgi:hypothetical protein